MTRFDFQPSLTDGLVTLRPLRAEDWASLHAVARDPAIWASHPARERWREPMFRRFFDDCLASGATLVIEDALNGEVLGSSRFDTERAGDGEIEIGWTFLTRSRWGGTTNAAVKRLMIGHALATFERVIFLIAASNSRSRRALEKIGGALLPRHFDASIDGQAIRHVIYGIDRASFANGPLQASPIV
ncbi:GNAT family N-acetyltransferase [Novosphingobium sp.]|uniref:GNAT family N-acetyltransferase n=1 Tax=Novosphingobium sp. TaxID=1874826 RepID=UPI0038BDF128